MSNTVPTSNRQLRIRNYTVNKLDTIRSAIAGYAGGVAIARELVQNADDAGSEYIEFHFTEDALLVRNGSSFSDKNLDDICRLASGSKRNDEETTGTWGTGFLSVYQITDYPELHSAGVHLIFDPECDTLEEHQSPETDGTVFRFAWRTSQTDISRYIEADNWPVERIHKFRKELCEQLYGMSPFLRNIRRLAVYGSTDKSSPEYEIQWSLIQHNTLANGTTHEVRSAHISKINHQVKDRWYFYSSKAREPFQNANGDHLKKPDVRVAFGVDEKGSLVTDQGMLYNFLPTNLSTGYRFHIQGDFFPDANRTTIITDTSGKAEWNRSLISDIARLFGNSLPVIRDDASNRKIFYDLLASATEQSLSFLEGVADQIRVIAISYPVIWTLQNSWIEPPKALHAEVSSLVELAVGHIPGLASDEVPNTVSRFLKVPTYTFEMFLERITKLIKPGTPLMKADPIVRGRDRLDKILDVILQQYKKSENANLIKALKRAPLCLYHSGLLYPFSGYNLYCADDEIRGLFDPQSLNLIESIFQARHEQLISVVGLTWAGFESACTKVKSWEDEYRGKPVADCSGLRSTDHIKRLMLYFFKHTPLNSLSFVGFPLCPDTHGVVGCVGDFIYTADADYRTWLSSSGVRFISDDIQSNDACMAFLRHSSHPTFTARTLVDCMSGWFAAPCPVQEAYPLFNSPVKWKKLAHFLADHSADLNQSDMRRLRDIPFIPTQQGKFASIDGNDAVLKLPPRAVEAESTNFLELLEVDNLIDTRYADRKSQEFLRTKLGVRSLSVLEYISGDIIRHYDRAGMSHKKRFDLLRLMRDTPELRNPKNSEIQENVRRLSLIRCTDDIYRRPLDVYIQSEALDTLLPNGYPTPHRRYGLQIRDKARHKASREQEQWQEFFEWLGLRSSPATDDLTTAIIETVSALPTQHRIEHVRAAYNYLYDHWGDLASDVSALVQLQEVSWLPAVGDLSQWYKPKSLYPTRLQRLIESQAKILMFREPPQAMSDFFSMNRDVQVVDVVNHLLWLSENQKVTTTEIFTFLSRHLQNPEIERLRSQHIYYDRMRARHWVPERVMFGDHSDQLGPYFGYVTDQPAEWMRTLVYLGAREGLKPVRDYVTLIQDIAHRFVDTAVDDNNAALLQQAYQQLSIIIADIEQREIVSRSLSRLACIMDHDKYLWHGNETCFKDRPDLLALFPEGALPCALYNTEGARDFLILMGVRPISELVQRSLHSVEGEELDESRSIQFRSLASHFRRIIRSYEDDFPSGWCDVARLNDIRVLRTNEIQVRYSIASNGITVEDTIRYEEAWFDTDNGSLYLHQSNQESRYALPREVAKILNSDIRPEVLTPIIKDLLYARDAKEATAVLDELGILHLDITDTMFARDDQYFTIVSADEELPDAVEDSFDPEDLKEYADTTTSNLLDETSKSPSEGGTLLPPGGVNVREADVRAVSSESGGETERSFASDETRQEPEARARLQSAGSTEPSNERTPHAPTVTPNSGNTVTNTIRSASSSRTNSSPHRDTPSLSGGPGGHYDPPKPGDYRDADMRDARHDVQVQEYRSQREGTRHKNYKLYLSHNLNLITPGLRLFNPNIQTEYIFPSLDRVDILCADSSGMAIPIEVETFIRPENYVGAWQAEKYRHLAALLNGAECRSTRSILVAPSIPQKVKEWCEEHRIEAYEVHLPSAF